MVSNLLDYYQARHFFLFRIFNSIPCTCTSKRWCWISINHRCFTGNLFSTHISCLCCKVTISIPFDLTYIICRFDTNQSNWWPCSLLDLRPVLLILFSKYVVFMMSLKHGNINMLMKFLLFSVKYKRIEMNSDLSLLLSQACVTLFLLLLTITNAAICWSNFDKGLKGHCKLKLFLFIHVY